MGWEQAYGPGPFGVIRTVDKGDQGLPTGLIVKTDLGEREINGVWLTTATEPHPPQPDR
jgi:hypothetical protein